MGDGGVACVPIMDNFTETLCNGGSNSNSNGKLESKPIKRTTTKRMKLKRDAFFKKDEQQQLKNESVSVSSEKVKTDKEVENGEVEQKDEVEEGELGTLKSPRREVENGELTPEISHRSEVEKGEIVEKGEVSSPSRWRKGEQPDRLEFSSGRLRSDVVARRDRDWTPEKYRKGEYEKGDFSSWRGSKDEVEKGEFFPERWHKGDALRDEYGYSKSFKADSVRERERRYDRDWSSPPGVKYSGEDVSPGRNFSRRGNNKNCKRVARWGAGQDKNYNSKVVDETPFYKNDHSHGRNQGREQSSGFRLKRHGVHSDSGERKHYDDHGGDHVSSKSRRISGGNGRGGYPEQHSRQSAEKSFKKSNPTRTPSDRVSIRQYDSSSSREAYDRHRRSPSYSERSPRDRERARYHEHNRDWTPARSPPGFRNHRRDNKNQSPSYAERSPQDRSRSSPQDRYRPHDRRDRSPSYLERSPRDRSRPSSQRKTGRRSEASDDKQSDKLVEEKPAEKTLNSKDSVVSPPKDHVDRNNMQNGSVEKSVSHEIHMEDQLQTPGADVMEQPASSVNEVNEEFQSMEEDMDICDTPPHVPSSVSNVNPPGKWYYLDYFGEERGPSSLCDLKALVEEGLLMSDHLVKHLDSDRWVTVENAASPMVTAKFTPIFSDTVTQLVCPPEAPGNVLVDMVDAEQTGDHQVIVDGVDASSQTPTGADDTFYFKDPSIDERVGALLEGFSVIPGRELEIVGEALQMSFDWSEWETLGCLEGFAQGQTGSEEPSEQNQEQDNPRYPESEVKDAGESTSVGGIDKESGYLCSEFTEWFSTRWSCKGGDWQRNDEATQEKSFRKKVVLNDGYPVCQMPKSGYEDPRWQRKEDLYFPCQSKRLDLPSWAISWPDEKTDGIANKSTQSKSAVLRGVKGTVMPVIRINACVVKDHGAIVSESRSKLRTKDKYSSKGTKHLSSSSDLKRFRGEDASKSFNELDTVGSWKSSIVNKPKDRLCTVDDLQLHLGNWYYIDGTGHEHGPYSSTLLQKMVHDGYLKKESSVFRKLDKVWVPLTSVIEASQDNIKPNEENVARPGGASEVSLAIHGGSSSTSSLFHNLHPQFIGYTRGKLHELVMKSYKSREFAAAINEVLDPWINSRQPKKEMEKHLLSKPMNKSHHYLQKSAMENGVSLLYEDDTTSRKRRRISIEEEEYVMAEDLPPLCSSEPSFDELCGDTLFSREENEGRDNELEGWGLLDGSILARIFHFLRADAKSLVFASLTCKHWRTAVGFYKNLSIRVDLSAMGSNCTDSVIGSIMSGYNKQVTKALILEGCTSISFTVLEELLRSFPCITCVDIRGCNQFEELIHKFPHVTWVKGHTSQGMRIVEDSDMKIRTSSKQMAEQMCSASSRSGHGSYMDESSGLKDYFDMVDRRGAANQSFRQSLYKRTKVIDARKSASALAREARMRHWAMKKAGSGYRRMEEFLVLSLKDIMKGKTSDYFAPKVAEIENRIRSGHYARHGLSSAKQDIIKMCRDAIKMKNRGDGGDMEHMITLFTKLGTCLDDKTAIDKDEMMKKLTDESSGSCGFKKYSKSVTERKYMSRAGSSVSNGGSDYGYSSDREVRRNLSKTNKKLSSESESSDEFELSSEDDESDTESVSDTQSDSDVRSEGALESKGGYLSVDESFDLIPDDREWGARMTKASLVPPVTRKYEVIDHYVIVADEAEVQRKMQVSLPDDYEDKVKAQKNGLEEVDMEIPEVKEYKPRKQLGEEVIEQEVYGIDPYTHNLLLDSIKDVVDWLPAEKDVFIEDVLLRVLNRQVRHYTGSGSTPMTYPLRPVIEEVLAASKEEHDMRTAKLCESLLNAIDSRPEDNYVSYRKGLGVVCNKKEGFTVDDFVVEFLGEVYPAWKWFEKQDGIRSLQKNSKDPAPEFYNIYLERPKGDADGYDLVVVDAMHKANYASRICHSCQPNCEAKVTAVDGQYQIGIYSVRPIGFGEEITFDYNSVTESKEEYEASVCLCGSHVCRGSYLNLTGEGAFQKVLKEWHGLLDKHSLLLEACELNWVSEEDYIELGKAGLGSCLLGGLPDWLVAYSARLVRFINLERIKLPDEIIRHAAEEKKKYGAGFDVDKPEAEIQAEGVYNQRLQNLALTLDKVRYVLRCVFGDPKKAPPPLQKLSPHEMVSAVWNGEGSLVSELLDCIAPHVDDRLLLDLKSKICAHDPSNSGNIEKDLKKSLLWLRDEVRNLPCTYKSRHDAAADLIHIYAYTKNFFKIREYKAVTSPPVYISPLDLGPKCADKLSGVTKYRKTYGENYCLGQLIYWHNQANAEPDRVLARASRGCLSLPEISSFYAKAQKPSRQRVYGPRTLRFMLARMEKQPQRAWPKDRIWCFNSSPKIFGSPMLDAVLSKSSLEREMVVWLKNRPAIFQAMWDR